jgi:hypothetical protein
MNAGEDGDFGYALHWLQNRIDIIMDYKVATALATVLRDVVITVPDLDPNVVAISEFLSAAMLRLPPPQPWIVDHDTEYLS